jgi:hypothetical protein
MTTYSLREDRLAVPRQHDSRGHSVRVGRKAEGRHRVRGGRTAELS